MYTWVYPMEERIAKKPVIMQLQANHLGVTEKHLGVYLGYLQKFKKYNNISLLNGFVSFVFPHQ